MGRNFCGTPKSYWIMWDNIEFQITGRTNTVDAIRQCWFLIAYVDTVFGVLEGCYEYC